jgi:2-phosphosulfolactate phosphatase
VLLISAAWFLKEHHCMRPDQHEGDPRVRLAWGWRGAQTAAERGDILVVIDTLRFSTAAATAVHHGALIYPCTVDEAQANALAERVGGEVAWHSARPRQPSLAPTRFTLSPRSFLGIAPGTRVVLPSPNGSTCCRYGSQTPALFVGALVNAQAVAREVSRLLAASPQLTVTVLPCGERWHVPHEEGILRFALEDYLGAGAILSSLQFTRTIEAQACAATFTALRDDLEAALWECESGQELRSKGLREDVRDAAQLDKYDTAPVLRAKQLDYFLEAA